MEFFSDGCRLRRKMATRKREKLEFLCMRESRRIVRKINFKSLIRHDLSLATTSSSLSKRPLSRNSNSKLSLSLSSFSLVICVCFLLSSSIYSCEILLVSCIVYQANFVKKQRRMAPFPSWYLHCRQSRIVIRRVSV